ncbi:hypothetical protein [Pseudomonas fluorescens]|nr:hypothetical protein [Pseudomonas fluorescens]
MASLLSVRSLQLPEVLAVWAVPRLFRRARSLVVSLAQVPAAL